MYAVIINKKYKGERIMKTRILALLLICMLLLAFVSCGGDEPSVTTKSPSDDSGTGTVEKDKWDGVNFSGEEIIISLSNYEPNWVISAGATNGIIYVKGPDSYTTDAVQNAVYDRNKKVSESLGLSLVYQECNQYSQDPDNTLTVIENFVLADLDNSPDIISTMSYGMVRAGIKGNLYNALTKDYENYFDFTTNGWYSDFMYENTLDESKIFMLAGDYFIDVFRYAYGVMVNLDMYDDVMVSEGGSASLFDVVEAGEWTYDEMMRTANMAYVDKGTVGYVDNEDIFGVIHHPHWVTRTLFSTSGLDVFEIGEDEKIQYVQDITDIHNFVDKILDMSKQPGFYFNGKPGDYNQTDTFIQGRSLYQLDAPILNMEGTLIQNMDEKVGIIPYPKYNVEESYAALLSDNGNTGGILYNSDKFTECSALLQMMAEESDGGKGTLIYEYYDVTLKYKISNTPEQVAMLDYIRHGLCSPKSMLYDNYFAKNVGMNGYFIIMDECLATGTNTFSSSWESQCDAVQNSLDATLDMYGEQQ